MRRYLPGMEETWLGDDPDADDFALLVPLSFDELALLVEGTRTIQEEMRPGGSLQSWDEDPQAFWALEQKISEYMASVPPPEYRIGGEYYEED
jgi:hypothetical protein